jgi:small subunit ribosomal protein S6
LTRLYEGMFLLDNQVVREDWNKAKGIITETLAKHGAKVLSARRWDERKLAYPIKKKNRATFLLAYYEMGNQHIPELRRDLELNERVLRYMILQVEAIPTTESELAAAEQAEGFAVPAPPPDDAPEPAPEREQRGPRRRDEGEEQEIFVPDLENLPEEA